MKDERKKIKRLAKEFVKLEKKCQSGNNISENMAKLEQLTKSLSLEEMLAIDNYIYKKRFLTK